MSNIEKLNHNILEGKNLESKEKEKEIRVKFLHSPQFDSEPEYVINDWHKIVGVEYIEQDDGKIIWAWPVKEDDVEDFLDDNAYGDNGPAQWEEIDSSGKFVYAIPYDAFRDWLQDKQELPLLESFDPKRHTMVETEKTVGIHRVPYYDDEGRRTDLVEVADFSTDFAVIISPTQMTKRWNKVWEGDSLEKQEASEDEQDEKRKKAEEQRQTEINPRQFKN